MNVTNNKQYTKSLLKMQIKKMQPLSLSSFYVHQKVW